MNIFSSVFNGVNNGARLFFIVLFFITLQQTQAQDIAPILTATGNQSYCPGTPLPVVTSFSISDLDDTGAPAIYIQIASGYQSGQDQLALQQTYPNITTTWNTATGTLTVKAITGEIPFAQLKTAVENVVYINTSTNPSPGTRTFSITPGDANYLPSTQHYYRYIASEGILWTNAKTAAENSTYYGLQGYLATLLTYEEAQLCGEQATGTGWIGGSDAASEGVWKWVTGPEAGTTFWNGAVNGTTPNFEFWNNGEPNNDGDEDYAHITAPGVGIPGSWNDLPNTGGAGQYAPKGYIVEYGGMPGDPVLQISASTTITVVNLTSTIAAQRCGNGTVTLQAISTGTLVYWYDASTGGNLLSTNAEFTTPVLVQTTTYYASAYPPDCTTATRLPVLATINALPTTPVADAVLPVCYGNTAQLIATTAAGSINWYNAAAGGMLLGTGNTFTTPALTANTTFYAEAVNNGCPATTRQAVTVSVLPLPVVPDEDIEFCENSRTTISAGITGATYKWSTGATTESITITEPGEYIVEVTNTAGCTATKIITADTLPTADIVRIEVNSGTATIIMGDADLSNYEFAIDNGSYRSSNVFTNLSPGQHTAHARSINDCGDDARVFNVYMIPMFFTPNGDNINDSFTIAGMYAFPQATINIFDRYGKVVAALSSRNRSWDGTFNGNRLPATDYWYIIKLDDKTPEIKGHFSLIR